MIGIEELQETIEQSIDCSFDLSSLFIDKHTLCFCTWKWNLNGEPGCKISKLSQRKLYYYCKNKKFDTSIENIEEKIFV